MEDMRHQSLVSINYKCVVIANIFNPIKDTVECNENISVCVTCTKCNLGNHRLFQVYGT